MARVLRNELLGKCGSTEIYKTYDKEKHRYGLYKKTPFTSDFIQATYIHIFPFQETAAAAITEDEELVWINSELIESPMQEDEKCVWQCIRVQNSKCNCFPDGDMFKCELCVGGIIFNAHNWKVIKDTPGFKKYEYYTLDYSYRITLLFDDSISISVIDYVWDKDDLTTQLKGIVDTYEEQHIELQQLFNVCVLQNAEGSSAVELAPFFVTIDIIDIAVPVDIINNQIIIE